jgi:hypothetical protein
MRDRLSGVDSPLYRACFEEADMVLEDWFGITITAGIVAFVDEDFVKPFFGTALIEGSRDLTDDLDYRGPAHVADLAISYFDRFKNVSVLWQGEMNFRIQLPTRQPDQMRVPPQNCEKRAFNLDCPAQSCRVRESPHHLQFSRCNRCLVQVEGTSVEQKLLFAIMSGSNCDADLIAKAVLGEKFAYKVGLPVVQFR